MPLSLIVAFDENQVIGADGTLPWRLSADLRRFKKLTMGHSLIMGRKTLESIGRILPGRTTVVLTRDQQYQFNDAKVATTPEAALEITQQDNEPFVVGGGEIYQLFLPLVQRLYLTRVSANVEGDTHFPTLNWEEWQQLERHEFEADEKNEFAHSFAVYERKTS